MLISSLIIFPALSAMQIADSFKGVIILSAIISAGAFLLGLLLSLSLPAGAVIVLCNLAVLLVCTVYGKLIKKRA
jgi:zinc transport system permease protein